MNELFKPDKSVTYQVKVQNGYVKNAYKGFNEVHFTPDIKKAKQLSQAELDFVLKLFPEAETRKYNITMEREW